jgi:hypothetical protein
VSGLLFVVFSFPLTFRKAEHVNFEQPEPGMPLAELKGESLNFGVCRRRGGNDEMIERPTEALCPIDLTLDLGPRQTGSFCGADRFQLALEFVSAVRSAENVNAALPLCRPTVSLDRRTIPLTLPKRVAQVLEILPVLRRR